MRGKAQSDGHAAIEVSKQVSKRIYKVPNVKNWIGSKHQSYFSPVVHQSTRASQQAEICTGATSICL